jgi:hypothetical protein
MIARSSYRLNRKKCLNQLGSLQPIIELVFRGKSSLLDLTLGIN